MASSKLSDNPVNSTPSNLISESQIEESHDQRLRAHVMQTNYLHKLIVDFDDSLLIRRLNARAIWHMFQEEFKVVKAASLKSCGQCVGQLSCQIGSEISEAR